MSIAIRYTPSYGKPGPSSYRRTYTAEGSSKTMTVRFAPSRNLVGSEEWLVAPDITNLQYKMVLDSDQAIGSGWYIIGVDAAVYAL